MDRKDRKAPTGIPLVREGRPALTHQHPQQEMPIVLKGREGRDLGFCWRVPSEVARFRLESKWRGGPSGGEDRILDFRVDPGLPAVLPVLGTASRF